MDDKQKEKIIKLRAKGKGYKTISNILGINVNTIKSFCKRKNINAETASKLLERIPIETTFCDNCGREINTHSDAAIVVRYSRFTVTAAEGTAATIVSLQPVSKDVTKSILHIQIRPLLKVVPNLRRLEQRLLRHRLLHRCLCQKRWTKSILQIQMRPLRKVVPNLRRLEQ